MRVRATAAIVAVVGCGPSAATLDESADTSGAPTTAHEGDSTPESTADDGDGTTTVEGTSGAGDDVSCVLHEKFDVGPPGCVEDGECNGGWICLEGQCEQGDCHTGSDCEADELCVSHFCEHGVQVQACADAVPWTAEPIDTWATWVIADVALADVNGDGADDVVAVEFHAPDSTLHVVNGATRAGIAAMTMEMTAFRLALADLDEDGRTDVLVGGRDPAGALGLATVEIDGVGLPGRQVMLPPESCAGANEVAAVDIDGDGHTDAVVLVQASQSVQWRAGDGTGALLPGTWIDTELVASRMAAADLDADGAADLVLAGSLGHVERVRGGATPQALPFDDARLLAPGDAIAIADIDGDGTLDLIAAGGDASTAAIDLAPGTGNVAFTEPTRVLVPGGFTHGLAAVDLDGDADLDLAFGSASGGVTLLRMTNGTPDCALAIPMDEHVGVLAAGDLNGDGTQDLAGSAERDGAGTLFVVQGGA